MGVGSLLDSEKMMEPGKEGKDLCVGVYRRDRITDGRICVYHDVE